MLGTYGIGIGRMAAMAGVVGLLACGGTGEDPGTQSPTGPTDPPPDPGPPPQNSTAYVIEYSTYLGGGQYEELREPVLLGGGRLLFGARTLSGNMPVTAGAFQPSIGGGEGDSYLGILSADGGTLEAGTYFGGSGMERPPYGVALTSGGDVVFTSGTASPDIPTSGSSYRSSIHSPIPSPGEGYACRISADLRALRWCTYLDGGWPRGGLVVDAQDNVIVTGAALGANFTPTPGAYQAPVRAGFTLKLSSDGTSAIFAALLGGISVQELPSGDLSVVGLTNEPAFPTTAGAPQTSSTGLPDAYATVLAADGSALLYSTLLGGSGSEFAEHPHVVMSSGTVLFGGVTQSPDLNGATGTFGGGGDDGFLARLSPGGSSFQSVAYVGGSGGDIMFGPVMDAAGNIYLVGSTSSRNLSTTADAILPSYAGGARDGFLVMLNPDGSVRFATYVGGSGEDGIRGVAIGPAGELYVVGSTTSADFPVTSGAVQGSLAGDFDGFVMKLTPAGN